MTMELVIAGGGIGGLAAAVAARRAGWEARLVEQAPEFAEVGAGLQLGPNATRRLAAWGLLTPAFIARCALPQRLRVRDAQDGRELAAMPLGPDFERRYGAPYVTLHRADLQQALLEAARAAGARMHTGTRVLAEVPGTYEELVAAWDERGIDFQRRLIEALLHPIIVNPARTRKRAFDPGRLEIVPKA